MNAPIKVLITGASGYIGTALMRSLGSDPRFNCFGTLRQHTASQSTEKFFLTGDLDAGTDWSGILSDVDIVIHAAGRAHVINDRAADRALAFRRVNVDATQTLALQAAKAGVKRFIFISSIGVNGSSTQQSAFSELQEPAPESDYARSKLEAELQLMTLFSDTNTQWTIIRPPMVYSANAPGNFRRLLKLAAAGFPLPLKSVDNRRSIIALENLIDFIQLCCVHPGADNEIFLIADESPVSTASMVSLLRQGMNKPERLLPIPVGLLYLGSRLVSKPLLFNQLCQSLVIDISRAQGRLGWRPVISCEDALKKAGQIYLQNISTA
ncbi:NAD-dependent epimerase/dehydratase family protein [Nitrincola alkalilacustris]|uniref:NAD-dependent epimerase/dehydratase family protein n=1 Tax=Nitrincola alkalilacustris TaxID=1571224 RepID=UPI00124DE9CA|nr:NAD-dependent epimerase/dehydratase family protein [Nitrincola alkalilacustris]